MFTTCDNFVSNYVDGYGDAFTGKEFDKRYANHAGYGEGFSAFDSETDLNKEEIEDLAYEAWDEYTGF